MLGRISRHTSLFQTGFRRPDSETAESNSQPISGLFVWVAPPSESAAAIAPANTGSGPLSSERLQFAPALKSQFRNLISARLGFARAARQDCQSEPLTTDRQICYLAEVEDSGPSGPQTSRAVRPSHRFEESSECLGKACCSGWCSR